MQTPWGRQLGIGVPAATALLLLLVQGWEVAQESFLQTGEQLTRNKISASLENHLEDNKEKTNLSFFFFERALLISADLLLPF